MLQPYLVDATDLRVVPESGVVRLKSLSSLGPSDESYSLGVFAWSIAVESSAVKRDVFFPRELPH